jgi:hypothetical protein
MSMSSNPENEGSKGKGDPQTFSREFQVANVSARVPEKISRGVFSTGVLILQGNSEFVLDFVLRMNQPHQVVARVIMPMSLVPQFIDALKGNLENHRKAFGGAAGTGSQQQPGAAAPGAPAATAAPATPQPPTPTIEEIYQDLKIADDVMVGAYANSVMVVHNASEFCLEFISNFYPRAVIAARVFLSAPQLPLLVKTLTQSWQNYQAKVHQQQQPKPPA